MTTDRRSFLRLMGVGGVGASLAACGTQPTGYGSTGASSAGATAQTLAKGKGRLVVVVGGGYGGTIAAKYIRMLDKSIEVVLIEPNKQFVSCPFSNLYIGGMLPDLSTLTIGYDKLAANHGITMVYDTVTAVDAAKKALTVSSGTIDYDQQVRPVGGHNLRKVDVQLLAATHPDLEAEVAARRFRADLFHRLFVLTMRIPPLSERPDDILTLARHFLSSQAPEARAV